jgi:hypothetical protein
MDKQNPKARSLPRRRSRPAGLLNWQCQEAGWKAESKEKKRRRTAPQGRAKDLREKAMRETASRTRKERREALPRAPRLS